MLYQGNNILANAPQCNVISTLPIFTLSAPCTVTHTREKDQQEPQFFLIIHFISIIINMLRTSNFSSSGGVLCKQLTVFHRAEIILKLYECMNCLDIDLVHRMSS